jgi:hypothetical protein
MHGKDLLCYQRADRGFAHEHSGLNKVVFCWVYLLERDRLRLVAPWLEGSIGVLW